MNFWGFINYYFGNIDIFRCNKDSILNWNMCIRVIILKIMFLKENLFRIEFCFNLIGKNLILILKYISLFDKYD